MSNGSHWEIDDLLGEDPQVEFNDEHGAIFDEQTAQRRALRWLGHEVQAFKKDTRDDLKLLKQDRLDRQAERRVLKWIGGPMGVVGTGSLVAIVAKLFS